MMKNSESSGVGIVEELEKSVLIALQNYSNVHRGSGHNSMTSTHLYEQARTIVLEYLELDEKSYNLIFCSPRRAEILTKQIKVEDYTIVSSNDLGLAIGVCAVAIKNKALPKGNPFQTGGGTTSLISQSWIVWAKSPDKFEAGTPAIVNVILFAKALKLIKKYGKNIFLNLGETQISREKFIQDDLQAFHGQELLDKLKLTLIGANTNVPTMEGKIKYTNLDNSASTPTFEPIWNSFCQNYIQTDNNPIEIAQNVREVCAKHVGSSLSEYEVIFTSNTTEAINLCAENFSRSLVNNSEALILSTILEHSSNDLPWRMIPGSTVIRMDVDDDGFIDLNELESVLKSHNQDNKQVQKRIKLMAISGASNVLGSCNDLAAISQIVHKYGAQLLVDGAQLIAHRKIDMSSLGIDFLAFSAHKVYAPFGCGVLIARKELLNFNHIELQHIHSLGEHNTGGIAAMGKALEIIQRIGMEIIEKEEYDLTKKALRKLSQINGLKIYGIKDINSPRFNQKLGVIVFDFKGIMADKVAKGLSSQSGIGVRNGCMCAHILIKRIINVSPFLERFQRLIVSFFPGVKLPGLTRISFGLQNNEDDIDTLIQALPEIAIKDEHPASLRKKVITQTDSYIESISEIVYG